ncbi:MAG: acyl-CoA reductase [Bacteroidia bacterium]|nr:acyl-CoA reductase [Bacteroidia bacterium]
MALQSIQLLKTLQSIFAQNTDNIELFQKAEIENPWFTQSNCKLAFESWANSLTTVSIEAWIDREGIRENIEVSNKKVGVILAGNLPLVGLHDILCCLIVGHSVIIKPSSQDSVLIKWVVSQLTDSIPELKHKIMLSEGFVKGVDAYIGTGSNNSARYFEYYFKNKPNLIRKNRTSVAIIDDSTTDEEIKALGKDVFSYFGMGCRNVTHLFLPEKFDLENIIKYWTPYLDLINHHKYANNYTYHKAILLMNLDKHIDTGCLIMVERDQLQTPVAMLGYSYYKDISTLLSGLNSERENIQCVVANNKDLQMNTVSFGATQHPELWDYADGVNTIQFLKQI